MIVSLGNDHAGTSLKKEILEHLSLWGVGTIDHGTDSEESVDYPDFIHPVARDVEEGKALFGIIFCGSGNGAAMTANKRKKIRAALCWNSELALLARKHNDANVLSIPARFVSFKGAKKIAEVFLKTKFGGGRHERRIKKIPCP